MTGTRHIAVKDNLIELTADICHQVRKTKTCFSSHIKSAYTQGKSQLEAAVGVPVLTTLRINIQYFRPCVSYSVQLFSHDGDAQMLEGTQGALRVTQMGSPTHGGASKRRRIEMGWEVLRDHLQPHHSDFDVIPW